MRVAPLFSLLVLLTLCSTFPAAAQARFTVGGKAWYAKWPIAVYGGEGGAATDLSFALLAGPYANIRFDRFGGTVMYMRTTLPFSASFRNPGFLDYGNNMNMNVVREDFNLFLNYAVTPDLGLFVNGKLMRYRTMTRWRFIDTRTAEYNEQLTVTGLGGGVQVTLPFSGQSKFYAFISTGAVYNVETSDRDTPTRTELLYFLDSGFGYRFVPSMFGVTFGIRAEAGYETNVIMGPVLNAFYTF
jgi:hypothetical protein